MKYVSLGILLGLLSGSAWAHPGHGVEPGVWHGLSHGFHGVTPFLLIAILMGLLAVSWGVARRR